MKIMKLVTIVFILIGFVKAQKVIVDLRSNWASTPINYEISEFIYKKSNSLFWDYFDSLSSSFNNHLLDSEEDFYRHSIDLSSSMLSSPDFDLLKFSLISRYFQPLVVSRSLNCPSSLNSSLICSQTGNFSPQKSIYETPDELKGFSRVFRPSSGTPDELDAPGSDSGMKTCVLYGRLGEDLFREHVRLKGLAEKGEIVYLLRDCAPISSHDDGDVLPGYGVELALKNLEYKTVDDAEKGDEADESFSEDVSDSKDIHGFYFGKLKERKPDLSAELDLFKSQLLANEEQLEDLKVWHLKELDFQACQRILSSGNPLRLTSELSHNFPTVATTLARLKVNRTLKEELSKNSEDFDLPIFMINNRILSPDTVDLFQIYKIMESETEKFNTLTKSMVLSSEAAASLLNLQDQSPTKERFKLIGDEVLFLNDIESDQQYRQFNSDLRVLFRPVWPGSFHYVRKNIYTAVSVLDAGDLSHTLSDLLFLQNAIRQNVPIRFGVLFLTSNPIAETFVTIFKHKLYSEGSSAAFSYAAHLERKLKQNEATDRLLMKEFSGDFDEISSAGKEFASNSRDLATKLGLEDSSRSTFLNGLMCNGNDFRDKVQDAISKALGETSGIQDMVKSGILRTSTDVYAMLMDDPHAWNRYNRLVFPEKKEWVSDPLVYWENGVVSRFHFCQPSTEDLAHPVSLQVVADMSTANARNVVRNGFLHLLSEGNGVPFTQLSLVSLEEPPELWVAALLGFASSQQNMTLSLQFGLALLDPSLDTPPHDDPSLKDFLRSFDPSLSFSTFSQFVDDYLRTAPRIGRNLQEMLNFQANDIGLLANGQILRLPPSFSFLPEDFDLLSVKLERDLGRVVGEIVEDSEFSEIDSAELTAPFLSEIIAGATALVGASAENERENQRGGYDDMMRRKVASVLISKPPTWSSPSEHPGILLRFAVDPLSRVAQRLTPIIEVLLSTFRHTQLDLLLLPSELSGAPPLQSFYRFVLSDQLEFDIDGKCVGPSAQFDHLPTRRLLTLNLDTPESWLATAVSAKHDLDNINLQDLGREKDLYATFELDHLLIQGNCFDYSSLNMYGMPTPPRGLELVLSSPNDLSAEFSTLVMSNFGYFQLKANPGYWVLKLRENSKSSDLYTIVDEEGNPQTEQFVEISKFGGSFPRLSVLKKEGKEDEHLLLEEGEQDQQPNFISSLFGMDDFGLSEMGTARATKSESSQNETIHVFSLASGLLYERFLRIMMLSVLKNTKNPVKFWLLANFLSPKFKDFLPYMAKEHNFSVELVTYKWPAWLNKQTEKQRIIWGYKILFLDVLFPLNLKRVIYVDADQVVRADLKELWDMDLKGAPYAYTPFCSDRPEMDGFKFWKQGFWESHLRGKPYHISALYMVDLVQFRKLASGDNLRATYDQLSADPGSLANLDQDLPNYMQHQVKIFSLPQEWLWCETWCSQESKAEAKTIDLCNNPQTKTPKLENAMRIVSEWVDLDEEGKGLLLNFEEAES